MKYMKIFRTYSEYEQYVNSDEFEKPNMSLIEESETISITPEEEDNLFTFRIGDVEYQAEEGMTWADWCDSKYNSIGLRIGNGPFGQSLIDGHGSILYNITTNSVVHPSEKINKEYIYYLTQAGGGAS